MRRLSSIAVMLGMTACATPTGVELVDQGKRDLDAATSCCTSLHQAKRSRLPLEKTRVVLDKNAQAFDFGGVKAFFMLYELPAYAAPYSIVLSSLPGGLQNDKALFIPRVALYDGDMRPTRYFDEKTLRNRGDSLERTVFINPQNAQERYMAVFGSDMSASIERAYSFVTVTPVMAGPVMFNMYGGQDGKSTLRSSPTGMLDIETQGLAPVARK